MSRHTMLQEPVVKAVMFLTAQEVREGPLSFMPHARSTQWFIHGQDIIPAEGGKLPAMRFMAEANGWTPDELMPWAMRSRRRRPPLTMSRTTATTRAWPMRWHISR